MGTVTGDNRGGGGGRRLGGGEVEGGANKVCVLVDVGLYVESELSAKSFLWDQEIVFFRNCKWLWRRLALKC